MAQTSIEVNLTTEPTLEVDVTEPPTVNCSGGLRLVTSGWRPACPSSAPR